MNNTEVTTILCQFNEWRRGDEDIPQFDPREIGEAIDAAIAMIEQLEAAESDALEQARLNGMGASREATLMAKLEATEKERDFAKVEIARLHDDIRELTDERLLDEEDRELWTTLKAKSAEKERDALRAKIEAMEKQEPVKYEIRRKPRQDNTWSLWKQTYKRNIDRMPSLGVCSDDLFDYEVRALYLSPGAKGE